MAFAEVAQPSKVEGEPTDPSELVGHLGRLLDHCPLEEQLEGPDQLEDCPLLVPSC